MKKQYCDPQLELFRFDAVDVLTTSLVLAPDSGETEVDGGGIF